MAKRATLLQRLQRLWYGKPVSHEEQRAAQHRPTSDPMVDSQQQMRNQRFHAGF